MKIFFLSLLLTAALWSQPRPILVELRNIEGKGIGYNQGYTTFEGFFAFNGPWEPSQVPILDIRAHLFNDAHFAGNAGLGLRYLGDRIWGIHPYFDYRQTRYSSYYQGALCLESLGEHFDVRLNGYLPVWKKKSRVFHTHHRQFSLKAINAEIGFPLLKRSYGELYGALGSYFLDGDGKKGWGGETYLYLSITDYFKMMGRTSYDQIFHWTAQGGVAITIPLGRKEKPIFGKEELQKRLFQPVIRHEIIPTDTKRVTKR